MRTQLQKGAEPPLQFLAHVYCGQMAGCIKMALGMEVGLGPGHFVLDGDPDPLRAPFQPIFGPYLLWPNGWMNQDATWYGDRHRPSLPGDFVLDGDPAPTFQKGDGVPPQKIIFFFGPCLL